MKATPVILLLSSSTGSSWLAIFHLGLNLQWKLHIQSLKALPQVSLMHQHRLHHFISSSEVMFRKATTLESRKAFLDLAKALLCCYSPVFLKNLISIRCDLELLKLKWWLFSVWSWWSYLFVYRYLELSLHLFKESSQQTTVLVQETSFFVLGFLWALF